MNTLQEFTSQIFRFMQTCTIYDPFIATRYADTIEDLTGDRPADINNPYYLHLEGKMFNDQNIPELRDEQIIIPSLDPEENVGIEHLDNYHVKNQDGYSSSIILTRDSIDAHPVTKFQYLSDFKRITMLLDRHLLSSDYIKNCFFTTDLTYDHNGNVDIKPFTLLSYGTGILESNEEDSIISEIQMFLEQIRKRWIVDNYLRLELYAHDVFNAVLWTLLHIIVIKKRVDNLHTANVHSELLWEYLMGCGLGDYRDVLNRDQQLFLYKNIKYLLYNRGTSKTLKILADKLLSPYYISLNEKRLLASTNNCTDHTVSTPIVVRKNILDDKSVDNQLDFEQYSDVYGAEILAGLEPDFGPELLAEQEHKLKYASLTTMPTKLLEFNAELSYDLSVMEYIRFAIETTMYLALNDKFNYGVSILFSGTEMINLDIKGAFALLMYAFWMSEAPIFTLTDKNKTHFIGKRVLVGNNRITLTNENVDDYLDSIVTLIGPVTIPRKFGFMRPYKFNPDLSNNIFVKDDVEYSYESILGDDILQNRDTFQDTVYDKDEYLNKLDTLFARRVSDLHIVNSSMTTTVHYAMDALYRKLLYRGVATEIDLVDPNSVQTLAIDNVEYIRYEDWFSTSTALTTLMRHLDSSPKMQEDYEKLARTIIDEIVVLSNSQYGRYETLSTSQFKAMRKLFIQLCSYDVVFLDTYTEVMDPMYIPQIVSEDIDTVHITERAKGSTTTKVLVSDQGTIDDPNPIITNTISTDRTGLVTEDTFHDYEQMGIMNITPKSELVPLTDGQVADKSVDVINLNSCRLETHSTNIGIGGTIGDSIDINTENISVTKVVDPCNDQTEVIDVAIGFPEKYTYVTVLGELIGLDVPTGGRTKPIDINTGTMVGYNDLSRTGSSKKVIPSGSSIIYNAIKKMRY